MSPVPHVDVRGGYHQKCEKKVSSVILQAQMSPDLSRFSPKYYNNNESNNYGCSLNLIVHFAHSLQHCKDQRLDRHSVTNQFRSNHSAVTTVNW